MNAISKDNKHKAGGSFPYIHESEAAKRFNVSKRWLLYQRNAGKLHYSKVANKVFYRVSDLEALFDKEYTGNP